MATLVLMTTSLPHSPSGHPDGISNRQLRPKNPHHVRPKICLPIRATTLRNDVGGKLVKRGSQPLGTLARTLEPRQISLPCGSVPGGGRSRIFRFESAQTIRLLWDCKGPLSYQVVWIVEANPNGLDQTVVDGLAYFYEIHAFTPIVGRIYYIQWLAPPHLGLEWFFAPI